MSVAVGGCKILGCTQTASFVLRRVWRSVAGNQLLFQRGNQRLGGRPVPAVRLAAHAALDAVLGLVGRHAAAR
jgi:hypothetical protein